LLGAPSIFIAGPFGIAATASLGALIGGGTGLVAGSSGGIYAATKLSFFQLFNTSMQYFAEHAAKSAEVCIELADNQSLLPMLKS